MLFLLHIPKLHKLCELLRLLKFFMLHLLHNSFRHPLGVHILWLASKKNSALKFEMCNGDWTDFLWILDFKVASIIVKLKHLKLQLIHMVQMLNLQLKCMADTDASLAFSRGRHSNSLLQPAGGFVPVNISLSFQVWRCSYRICLVFFFLKMELWALTLCSDITGPPIRTHCCPSKLGGMNQNINHYISSGKSNFSDERSFREGSFITSIVLGDM